MENTTTMELKQTSEFGMTCMKTARQIDWEARSIAQPSASPPYVNQTVRYATVHRTDDVDDRPIQSTLILTFQRDIRGWKIKGRGRQGNAPSFHVMKGFLSDSNRRAYWIEQHKSRMDGPWKDRQEQRHVLVKGTFDESTAYDNIFDGVRISRTDVGLVERPYERFARDDVIYSRPATQLSIMWADQVNKHVHDQHMGVSFVQNGEDTPVIISGLAPDTVFGSSRLAVGMPVVLINHERIQSPSHAVHVLNECPVGVITIVAFRDESVYHAPLARRLVSTTLVKTDAATMTGMTFVQRGNALFVGSVREGSLAELAGLEEFSRVWSINGHTALASAQAAADLILSQPGGPIHVVTDPTGSMDIPVHTSEGQAGFPGVISDDIVMDDLLTTVSGPESDSHKTAAQGYQAKKAGNEP